MRAPSDTPGGIFTCSRRPSTATVRSVPFATSARVTSTVPWASARVAGWRPVRNSPRSPNPGPNTD